ncbi:hypothetical protein OG21DRAFT_1501611 [Imleria badia]|nr:hypothetical protein OG21DRAFT_1501611 [Imleria badia]
MMNRCRSGPEELLEIYDGDDTFAIAFFPDGEPEHLVSGGSAKTVRRWQAKDGREVARRSMKSGGTICDVAVSPDGNWILSGGNFGVAAWNATTHAKVIQFDWPYEKCVWAIDVSPDSTRFATASLDRTVCIWSIPAGEQLLGPLTHEDAVASVRYSPRGDRIATATVKCHSVRVYDSHDGGLLCNIVVADLSLSSTPFTWSLNGQLFFVSGGKIQCFDASTGAVLQQWNIPCSSSFSSIALSSTGSFIACSLDRSISFWDTSTRNRIGPIIAHSHTVNSLALSPKDAFLASGGYDKKITLRDLRAILPRHYFSFDESSTQTPLLQISEALLEPWIRQEWTNAENVLAGEMTRLSRPINEALACRSLIRAYLRQWTEAYDDAEESLRIHPTAIGHIARAISLIGKGDRRVALRQFDLVFRDCEAHEIRSILLIKAILYFVAGKQDKAISRIRDLVATADDDMKYCCHQLLGNMYLQQGDCVQAIQSLEFVQDPASSQSSSFLNMVTLWTEKLTTLGDEASEAKKYDEAISRYTVALSLDPSQPISLLIKRSKARAQKKLWVDALEDGKKAINLDGSCPWGYEAKHAALIGLQRYDEAMEAFNSMLSAMENSPDQGVRQLRETYVSPAQVEAAVDTIVQGVCKICPLVLIDVGTGRLCDVPERIRIFKSEPPFKALVSSMTRELDHACILRAVAKYFQYVMLSHVWQGREPSFQNVSSVESVQNLDSSPLNDKLRNFSEVVREEGYRWAWSDTCCIDKTSVTGWGHSLSLMYRWYAESAATLVYLACVSSPSSPGDLTRSIWMTRAWTLLELLAPKVIRFYDCEWKPYLNDTRANHKDSPEIIQELATAIQVSPETITAFRPDDLRVREKLRLASTRNATVEEDVAYSLIGIFKSDIQPNYGEGDAALGHLLEEIVTRSGEVTVLSWTGRSSRYNSCLPATFAVYGQTPYAPPPIDDGEVETQVATLKSTLPEAQAMLVYDRIARLPPARFANRRIYLPCIVFAVKRLVAHDSGSGEENQYRGRVSVIGNVTFQTSETLPLEEPRKYVIVHPWISDLRDRAEDAAWVESPDSEVSESDSENEACPDSSPTFFLDEVPPAPMDDYIRALRLIVRLRRPFHALLLQQQPGGGYKCVAAEHEIVVQGLERQIVSARDIRAELVEIL